MFRMIDTEIVSLIVVCALCARYFRLYPERNGAQKPEGPRACLLFGLLYGACEIAAKLIENALPEADFSRFGIALRLALRTVSVYPWLCWSIRALYRGDPARGRRIAVWSGAPLLLYAPLALSAPWTGLLQSEMWIPVSYVVLCLYAAWLACLVAIRRGRAGGASVAALATVPPLLVLSALAGMPYAGYMLCCLADCLIAQYADAKRAREEQCARDERENHTACGFAEWRAGAEGGLEARHVSPGLARILELDGETLLARWRADPLWGVHPEDRKRVREALETLAAERAPGEIVYRAITANGEIKWLNMSFQFERHADISATVYATYVDISGERAIQKRLSDMIQFVPCGICIYSWDGDDLFPIMVNTRFSEMLGEDALQYLRTVKHFSYTHVHPDDLEALKREIYTSLTVSHALDVTYRSLNTKTGAYVWCHMRGQMIPQEDGTKLVLVSNNDVTQERLAQTRMRESEQALEFAADQAGLTYWRYDAQNDCSYPDERTRREKGLPRVVENFTEKWIDKDIVLPEYVPLFRDACLRMKNGEKQASFEARSRMRDGAIHWCRFSLTRLSAEPDAPAMAVGMAIPIDSEKELRAKYEMEKSRKSLEEDGLLAHAVFNLTTGETLEYQYQDGENVPDENRDAFRYCREHASLLIDDGERAQFLRLNDKDALLSRFEQGETDFRFDYRRRIRGGDAAWVRSALHLVRDPGSGDVLLFEYWYDIEEEKMRELMYKSIASDNYDYVARIDGRTGKFVTYPRAGLRYRMPPLSGDDADGVTYSIFEGGVVPEDREMAVHNTLVKHIKENLRATGRFQFTYREMQPDGSVRYKKLTQYYIDAQREIIAMLREDVTDLIHSEAEKNEILMSALSAANTANSAKSQFLSRVSHELRTPLNAIIGFMELAKDASPQAVDAYLANSDAAAKQLLSIINDVLDMSSIESGKMKLAHAPFDFKRLIHSVTNMYVPQCNQKGIVFDTVLLTPVDEWLLGDQLRVNQILLNLLGNAVKFTVKGGVKLSIRQSEGPSGTVLMHFEVADTGCGMSEQMLERLFKPFEQESAAVAQKYGGNGLGLSIVKSLAQMMGGVVSAKSRLGEGTTFYVDLPFVKSEPENAVAPLEGTQKLRVLTVDDEAAERAYVSTVLGRIGVRHTCAQNGEEALSALARGDEENDPYNVCLVDWRMPNMDGIETTRRIREKYGKNPVVIVISAYEHYQADESAKEAGANMFITKPLFQSSLFDLFATLTGGSIARKPEAAAVYDFKGRRVLLAEDNAMNRMVAEVLISQKFGARCDSAEDGEIALNRFLGSAPGEYDAILMDIQMPNMDGLEATRRIRASAHPDAKTVQIIALTANAFNEDIVRVLSCGMNAHVAKPISPAALAEALRRAFQESDRPKEGGRPL